MQYTQKLHSATGVNVSAAFMSVTPLYPVWSALYKTVTFLLFGPQARAGGGGEGDLSDL